MKNALVSALLLLACSSQSVAMQEMSEEQKDRIREMSAIYEEAHGECDFEVCMMIIGLALNLGVEHGRETASRERIVIQRPWECEEPLGTRRNVEPIAPPSVTCQKIGDTVTCF